VHHIAEVLQKNTYNIQVLGMVGSLLGLVATRKGNVAAIRPTPGKPIPTAKKLIDAGLVRGVVLIQK
jgi:hypothetical protein